MALGSLSDIERRYSRTSAAYAIRVPSGEISSACRGCVNCCPGESGIAKRITVDGADRLDLDENAATTTAPIAIPATIGSARRQIDGRGPRLPDVGAAGA